MSEVHDSNRLKELQALPLVLSLDNLTLDKKIYDIWHNIIWRCGNKSYPTYVDCKVCNQWQSFENFKHWYIENYYTVGTEKMCVDKDILVKHNKIYSPEYCCIVPEKINILFTNRQKFRGEMPLGVTYRNNKYTSKCKIFGKDKHLGTFDTIEQAFGAYKQAKEQYIRNIAEQYKNLIPQNVYLALLKYTIDITD